MRSALAGARHSEATYLIAMDVDGTLLTRDYRLLPEVRDAVQHARSHGILAMLATARGPAALTIVLHELGSVDVAVCFGGAMTLRRTADRWQLAFPDAVTHEITSLDISQVVGLADRLKIPVAAYTERGAHIVEPNAAFERELSHTREPVFVSTLAGVHGAVFKMLAISHLDRTDDLEALRAQLPATLEGVYSHPNYLEITGRGVSKGRALTAYCTAHNIDRSQVVAVGDSDNDVSMFLAAGHSAAMPDASIAARAAADWSVAPGISGTLATVIDRYSKSLWGIPPRAHHKQETRGKRHAS